MVRFSLNIVTPDASPVGRHRRVLLIQ